MDHGPPATGPRLIDSQIAALDCWVREYRGLLGIALTDCITMDAFLGDFDLFFASFSTVCATTRAIRWFGRKKPSPTIHKLIDPMSKTLVFSDSLTCPRPWKYSVRCVGGSTSALASAPT
jgi:nicotinate phosphoribosyltransferase